MPKLCPSLGFVAHPLRYIHVMPKEQVRERLHNALHRGGKKATEEELEAVGKAGYRLNQWDHLSHYFGGVSAVGLAGAAGDPRRSCFGLVLN